MCFENQLQRDDDSIHADEVSLSLSITLQGAAINIFSNLPFCSSTSLRDATFPIPPPRVRPAYLAKMVELLLVPNSIPLAFPSNNNNNQEEDDNNDNSRGDRKSNFWSG
jgi:hypothetical protein